MIALQPFVLLSLFQHGGVYLIGKQSPNSSLCFVLPEDGKIELTSFLCFMVIYSGWLRSYGIVWKHHSSPSRLLPLIVSQYISPSAKANETDQDLPCSQCQFHLPCGWGSQWDYVMIGQNNQTQACSLKCCCTVHYYHYNLERPSRAERGKSRGPRCHNCANSTPCWSAKKGNWLCTRYTLMKKRSRTAGNGALMPCKDARGYPHSNNLN